MHAGVTHGRPPLSPHTAAVHHKHKSNPLLCPGPLQLVPASAPADKQMQDQKRLAPRSASPQYVLDAIRRAVTLKPGDVFYDLGCGVDARILIAMAQATARDAQHQHQQQPQAHCSRPSAASQSSPPTQTAGAAAPPGPAAGTVDQHNLQETSMGAANGRLSEAAAHAAGTAPSLPRFVGVELDPAAAAQAAAAAAALPAALAASISIVQGDLLQVLLHDASVVYVYLLPQGLSLLASKLSAEAPHGCMLLSYMFKVPGWEQHLQATLPVTSGKPGKPDVSGVSKLYIYRKP